MKTRSQRLSTVIAIVLLWFVGREGSVAAQEAAAGERLFNSVGLLADQPLAAYRHALLDLAFSTASAIPHDPHVKDRCKAQYAVATAQLGLDQPRAALECVEKITDWRRGQGYAEIAFHCVQRCGAADVQPLLDIAANIAQAQEDWRRDRILVGIAKTHALLGQLDRAAELEQGVVDAEIGKVSAVRAARLAPEDFDKQLDELDSTIASGNFDRIKNALDATVQLFNRVYHDVALRDRVEQKIAASWTPLPISIRVDLLLAMAGFAVDHGDPSKAQMFVKNAKVMVDGFQWLPEDRVAWMARIAQASHRAGDAAMAKVEADAALAAFNANRTQIASVFRAGALRSVAEAYQSMGDGVSALSVYQLAVEEGAQNVNARPRAEDLSAVCVSMALHGVEPDAVMWNRMRQIARGLDNPW